MITGGNTGIGFETAKELAHRNPAKIILACRDKNRGLEAVNSIKSSTDFQRIEFMELDLNNLYSVKFFCQLFKNSHDKLDILINNAGIMALPTRQTTQQDHEK